MSEIELIVEELQHAHAGEPWHGSSRAALLAGISAEAAHREPGHGAHGIWQLVLHMHAWTAEVARRLRGGRPATPVEGDWPAQPGEPTESAWRAAIDGLDAAHAELLAAIVELDASRLDVLVGDESDAPNASSVTIRRMLHGVAQHDAFHSGQIALLKRIGAD